MKSILIHIVFSFSDIKKALCIGFFFVVPLYAQVSNDSIENLEIDYLSNNFIKANELIVLKELSSRSKDPNKILKYSTILIHQAIEADSLHYLFDGNLQKGNGFRLKGDLSKALEFYQNAAKIAAKKDNKSDLALTNITIGDVYSDIENHDNSVLYYEKGIQQLREVIKNPDKAYDSNQLDRYLASALLNAGDEYFNIGNYEKALSYFYESSALCNKANYKQCSAYNLGNIGMVYAMQNKPELAEANINEAIAVLEAEKDYYPISIYLNYISNIYLDNGQVDFALEYSNRSLKLAKKYQLKEVIIDANLQLSEIYEEIGEPTQSLFHLKKYIVYKDSITNAVQDIANKETEFVVSNKDIELELERQKRKNDKIISYAFLGGLIVVSGFAFGLYRRNKFINKTKQIINQEKTKSDQLLLNILPKETADELKKFGKVETKKYESVTVMFTDFKSFTKYAESSTPEKLVESVDMYFSAFDDIIEKYGLEKIKTIGDSYMCAAGLPERTDDHALKMMKAAIEMQEFVRNANKVHKVSELRFQIRIGMHTGPVVAGVVGKNKFSYDIWGDTVNIASRVESNCEANKINVSNSTYILLKDHYSFIDRGEVAIKNRGAIKMYYLSQ